MKAIIISNIVGMILGLAVFVVCQACYQLGRVDGSRELFSQFKTCAVAADPKNCIEGSILVERVR